MTARGLFPVLLVAGVAAALGALLAYRTLDRPPAAPKTAALLIQPARPLPAFSLSGDDGAPLTPAALAGHWSLLYFGYTHCPDVCPTTLADLSRMLAALGGLSPAEQPRVYFISVDPRRDSLALLRQYVRYFNPRFLAATAPAAALEKLTRPLGVAFSYDPPDGSGNYGVNHSAAVFLLNPRGEEAAVYTPPLVPARMAADYRAIVGYYRDRR